MPTGAAIVGIVAQVFAVSATAGGCCPGAGGTTRAAVVEIALLVDTHATTTRLPGWAVLSRPASTLPMHTGFSCGTDISTLSAVRRIGVRVHAGALAHPLTSRTGVARNANAARRMTTHQVLATAHPTAGVTLLALRLAVHRRRFFGKDLCQATKTQPTQGHDCHSFECLPTGRTACQGFGQRVKLRRFHCLLKTLEDLLISS